MQKAERKLLTIISLLQLDSWSVQSLLEAKVSYNDKFELAAIGNFLTKSKETVEVEDDQIYRRVTVRINNGGVLQRDTEKGVNIGTKRQYLAKAGQFIVSRIDARNGAFGLIPPDLDGAIVTNDFPLFDVDHSKIIPEFLVLITTTKEFIHFAQSCSSGTTNRQRMDIDLFLKQRIPLPTISEQKRIVKSYQNKIDDAERLEKEAKGLDGDIERYFYEEIGLRKIKDKAIKGVLNTVRFSNLNRWDSIFENTFKSKFPIEKIGNFITEISTGTTPPTNRSEYFINEVNFYTPSDIGNEMYLLKSERGVSMLAIKDKKARRFDKGTFLFVGIGSTVGKIGIVGNEFATSNQQITGFKVDEDVFFNEYVYLYFLLCKEFTIKEQTKATLPIVNQSKILNIPIPIPPISIQKIIAKKILSKQAKIATLKGESLKYKRLAFVEFEKEIFT